MRFSWSDGDVPIDRGAGRANERPRRPLRAHRWPALALALVLATLGLVAGASPAQAAFGLVAQWGGDGDGEGEFASEFVGLDVNASNGEVYVADQQNHRVQRFSAAGDFLGEWGELGGDEGEFTVARDVAVNPSTGEVYVTDHNNHRVQRFEADGTFIEVWGEFGDDPGQFDQPSGIAINPVSGDVYVYDTRNQRVQRFDEEGNFITEWDGSDTPAGEISNPDFDGVAVDPASGDVYITDTSHIVRFDADGGFVDQWDGSGTAGTPLLFPVDVAIHPAGEVLVADENELVQRFSPSGEFIGLIERDFARPMGLAVNASSGDLYVLDMGDQLVLRFAGDRVGAFAQASVSFGSVPVDDASGPQAATFRNTGHAPLEIESVGLEGQAPEHFEIVDDGCTGTLAIADECDVELEFRPASPGGKQALLSISSDDSEVPHEIALQGNGTAPQVTIHPPSLTFDSTAVGLDSDPEGALVTNTGDAPLTVADTGLAGPNASDFALEVDGCSGETLAPGEGCSLSVSFAPSAEGVRHARLDVNANAPDSPHSVALSGIGVAPDLRITPSSLDFGDVAVGSTSQPEIVTLEALGIAPVDVTGVELGGPDADDFAVASDECTGRLAPASSCEIAIELTPGSLGPKRAELVIETDATATPHSVELSGAGAIAGLPAGLALHRAQLDPDGLVVRGKLDPAAAGERVAMRLRTRVGNVRLGSRVRADGRFGASERARGPLRGARAGVLDVRFRGTGELRSARERVRAAASPVRLRIAEPRQRGGRLAVRGRVDPRPPVPVTLLVEFNRSNGASARIVSRARVDERGSFRAQLRVPPAVRARGASLSVVHRGAGRFFGQRIVRGVGG